MYRTLGTALVGILAVLALSRCAGERDPVARELTWHAEDGFRWAALERPAGGSAGFERLDSTRTGVGFVNTLSQEAFLSNRHYVNGSGVAVGDVNGDGWPDLYLTRLEGPNALYLNQGASDEPFRFAAAPEAGGAALDGEFSTGAALEDLDGDGDLDLVVTTMGGPNAAFRNDGTGRLTRYAAGLQSGAGSTTVALADIDGDRDLDLYVGNYKKNTVKDLFSPEARRFERVVIQENGEYKVRDDFQEHYEVRQQVNRLMRFEKAEPDQLYLNDGTGRFEAAPMTGPRWQQAGGEALREVPRDWALVARFQDLNGDGAADLYVCNDFESPDHIWLGDGQGGFQAIDPLAIRKTSHSTMSIDFADINRDSHVDFFMADMMGRTYEAKQTQMGLQRPLPERVGAIRNRPQESQNTLLVNRGDETWAEVGKLAGAEASGWTWSALFLDVDLDGFEDLLLTNGHHYDAMDADAQTRITNTNYGRNWRRSLLDYPPHDQHNAAYRNRGDGTFEAVPAGWGLGRSADVSHGMATGDLDRDGDLDVVVSRLNAPVGIYRNEARAARVAVRLRGAAPNTRGIGAKVTARPLGASGTESRAAAESGVPAQGGAAAEPRATPVQGAVPAQTKEMVAGGQYLSDSAAEVAFATGGADSVAIEVEWPGGGRSRVEGAANRLYEIFAPGVDGPNEAASDSSAASSGEGAAASSASAFQRAALERASEPTTAPPNDDSLLFEEVSGRIDHEHAEERYGDFQRQPLLSRRLSQQGPGAAWADVDGDGDDDLLIGSGRGGALAYYRNDGGGQFSAVTGGPMSTTMERDLTGIVVLPRGAQGSWVFVGRSNYEREPDEPAQNSQVLIYRADGSGLRQVDQLDAGRASVGPLALFDADGDGDLDLLVGGRHVPSRYPASASSRLFVNEGQGQFVFSERLSRPFEDVGMVSGIAAADFDGDGDQDLALATEWGPIVYLDNQGGGRFADRTAERGLDPYTGFWNGVAAGDFDGDGRLDLVGTNWGWNSKFGRPEGPVRDLDTPFLPHPLRVYYADFDRNGIMDVIETQYHEERGEYLPFRGLSTIAYALPYVRQRIQSFERFARSSLEEIFGAQRIQAASWKEAHTLSNMVFLQRGEGTNRRFEGRNLPIEAQYTPGFAPAIADFDGDGHEDILLSQNFFAVEIEMPRQDAGRGLLLRGQGDGSFSVMPGHESGIKVYGEQRAAPVADFDADGRLDILITQNGAATKMYRNVGGAPGLRVRLDGPAANPRGIGATVRLAFEDDRTGPARLVAAGSGYWSQGSWVPVMGRGDRSVSAVQVQWPDGTRSEADAPSRATSITVPHQANATAAAGSGR